MCSTHHMLTQILAYRLYQNSAYCTYDDEELAS
jgi:hypothetical protein